MHPLLILLATRPQLLLDHAQAYTALACEEFGLARTAWRQQVLLKAIGLLCLSSAVVLAGVALMLWAVTPVAQIHSLWVLWITPLVPLAVASACLGLARLQSNVADFTNLRNQFNADMALLRNAPPV